MQIRNDLLKYEYICIFLKNQKSYWMLELKYLFNCEDTLDKYIHITDNSNLIGLLLSQETIKFIQKSFCEIILNMDRNENWMNTDILNVEKFWCFLCFRKGPQTCSAQR